MEQERKEKKNDDATQANGHRRHNIGSLPYQYQPVVAMARHPFYIHSVTSHAVHFSHVNIKYHHTRGDLVLISFFRLFLLFSSFYLVLPRSPISVRLPHSLASPLGGWTCADHVPIPHVKHVHKVMVALDRID